MTDTQTPEAALRTPEAIIQALHLAVQGLEAGMKTPDATIQALHTTMESTIHTLQTTIHILRPAVKSQEVVETTTTQDSEDVKMDFGFFVTDDMEQQEVAYESESWNGYNPKMSTRLFYPLRLGELLRGRYLVEHKLGHGAFSTVWMAHDLHENKDVALKVLSLGGYDTNETRIQAEIALHVQDKSHLVVALDTFLLPRDKDGSFNTVHVLPLMGPRLARGVLRDMPVPTRMSAAQQLLKALKALHDAGIVHRDVSSGNCMWGMSSLDGLDRTAKYEKLNRPMKITIPHFSSEDFKEGELVVPADIPIELRTDDFFLGDFGISVKLNDDTFKILRGYPSIPYCSPERLHGYAPSFACDMWSYMVIFSQLYLGVQPFLPLGDSILAEFHKALGPLPLIWKGNYKLKDDQDDEESLYEGGAGSPSGDTLEDKIAKRRPDVDKAETDLVARIMRKVFVYSPNERFSASQLLEDSDFKELMQKYDCEC